MIFDAEVAAFGEGSATTCIGREGKMLRVSACTREEKSDATISLQNITLVHVALVNFQMEYMVSHSC